MVTKYDAFLVVHESRAPIKPIDVVKKLNKRESEYNNIHRLLTELEKSKLLIKTKLGFQARVNHKTRLLNNIIQYCLSNSINYNLLLDLKLVEFINQALHRKEICSKDVNLNPRTFTKYMQILGKDGLLLVISKKPIQAKIFYNLLVNNLLLYFDFETSARKEPSINYLEEIEQELKTYKRLRKKNEIGFQRIVDELEMFFVHHSLALEGNPITLPDTIKILKNKIIPKNLSSESVDEVRNYQTAILQMLRDSTQKNPLTIEMILDYHKLAMNHRFEIAGKIRSVRVHIKGNSYFKISEVSEIKPQLNQLLEKYQSFIKQRKSSLREIINFTAFFHNEFQHIHPFVDGNSRITRLITFHLLLSKDIPILDIPLGLLDEYLGCTKGSRLRENKMLYENLQKIILFNLKKVNERLSS